MNGCTDGTNESSEGQNDMIGACVAAIGAILVCTGARDGANLTFGVFRFAGSDSTGHGERRVGVFKDSRELRDVTKGMCEGSRRREHEQERNDEKGSENIGCDGGSNVRTWRGGSRRMGASG